MINFLLRIATVCCCLILAPMVNAYQVKSDLDEDAIAKRLQPVGEVSVAGISKVQAEAETTVVGGKSRYDKSCAACHGMGVAGAPKLGDKAAWGARLASKGLDTLITNAIKGINAMPAKGTCVECSDEEIRLTVEYMVNKSK